MLRDEQLQSLSVFERLREVAFRCSPVRTKSKQACHDTAQSRCIQNRMLKLQSGKRSTQHLQRKLKIRGRNDH